ncbi:PH domain-containing protein [Streptomyces sp. MS1.HAVA.3]|uniref:PH domain-containing protein n=1 Tax=Streptomyces caledonius TaxID=3134107 RepID=A0ABU8U614_9ACTN
MSSQQQPTDEPVYDDRVYRSTMGVISGVLLLALVAWLCGDALLRGSGNTPWIAFAVALCAVPLIVAFTIRPAVFANDDRMRVRNPFRIIELPWAAVDAVRAGYSAEVLAEGSKYQLWSVPVSLRERKKANRQQLRHLSSQHRLDRREPSDPGRPPAPRPNRCGPVPTGSWTSCSGWPNAEPSGPAPRAACACAGRTRSSRPPWPARCS